MVLAGIVDYVSAPSTQDEEAQVKRAARIAAQQVTHQPGMLLRMDTLRVVDSTVRYVTQWRSPGYAAYLSDANVTLTNVSNRPEQGAAKLEGTGAFMGSGKAAFSGTFRPGRDAADFDVAEDREHGHDKMNGLFRSYLNVDVSGGRFSFYPRSRSTTGGWTVRPLFEDVNVYSKAQTAEGPFKLWEDRRRVREPWRTSTTRWRRWPRSRGRWPAPRPAAWRSWPGS